MCTYHTEWNLSVYWAVLKHPFWMICMWTFGVLWGLLWQRKYLHLSTRQKHSENFLVICVFISQSWTLLSIEQFWNLPLGNLQVDFWSTLRPLLERKYIHKKPRQKHSHKLLWDACIHLTGLNLAFHWVVLKHSFVASASGHFECSEAYGG